ncbi:hypothetical protein BFJ68_g8848 [Fusarium oxysporum]|uniref:Rhodopsin domain-containing protein n=1 Tax=Fusarium oxysporum TaxID=5507 RepID=A0A420QZK7_FUSOX|nr:hypothetical protein BFJ68_g8848 [Fusarium oxysporum]
MADASQAWHAVKPAGLAAALLAVTVLFTPMILVVVGLRIWVRVTHHCFGLEDWLMCIGATLNLVHNGVVIWGSFTGIGTPDSKLNTAMVMEGFKVQTAQCIVGPKHRNMYGSRASIATIIRLPYSPAYSQPSDQLYSIGNIILWTVVECSLGIIAGSMPMLRKLFKALRKDDSSYARGTDDINLVTIGQVRGKHHPIYDEDVRATVAAGEDRESDRDDESTRQIIRVTKEFEQISVIEKPR